MGFGKAFGAGIALFIGINVGLTALVAILWGIDSGNMLEYASVLAGGMSVDILGWILTLLGGMMIFLYMPAVPVLYLSSMSGTQLGSFGSLINVGFLAGDLFTALGWIIVIALMVVVAIVVGYLAHSPGAGFGAMFLIVAIVTTLGVIGSILYNNSMMVALGGTAPTLDLFAIVQTFIVPIAIPTVVNGLALGAISMGMGYKYEE